MKNRSVSLIKNTTILSFGALCTKGIMFIMTPLFTRWLSTNDYGTFDLMVTYISLLIPILTLSSGEAVFRFVLGEEDKIGQQKILSTAIVINLFGLFLAIIASSIYLLINPANASIIGGFLLYLGTEIFYHYIMMALRGEKKLNIYTIGNITYVLGLAFFVTLFVLKLHMGLQGILFGYACGDIVSIFIMLSLSKLHKMFDINKVSADTFKKMISYSVPMIPNSISWWILNVSDRTLIVFFWGTTFNAVYAIANKIPALCTTFFSVFHLSWQQNATETMTDKDRDQYYSNVMNNMFQVITSICIVILGTNYWFFKLLFTDAYFSGFYQAPILVFSIIFSMLSQFIGGIYVAQMKSKKNGITTVMTAIINIIINFSLISYIGLYAASLSTLVSYLILFLVRYLDIKKEIKLVFFSKSIYLGALFIYFFISSYILVPILQTLNFILGCICFYLLNIKYAREIIKKLFKIAK